MISDRKIQANRGNARASTGPKSEQGRARSARNALRHGLSLPVASDPVLSEEVEALAREIAGPGPDAEMQDCARRVAAAQIDLRRVRYARHQLLLHALRNPHYESRASTREKMRAISRLLRSSAPGISMANLETNSTSMPQGPDKLATIVSEQAKQLRALDGYERRALSRRKFAVRAFDEMHTRINSNIK